MLSLLVFVGGFAGVASLSSSASSGMESRRLVSNSDRTGWEMLFRVGKPRRASFGALCAC